MANGEQIVFRIGSDVVGLTTGAQKGLASLASMEKQAKSLEKQIAQIGAAGVAFQRQVNEWVGVTDKLAGSARKSASAFEEFERAGAAVDDLRASLDPAYAATLRMQQAALKLDSALEMGVISAKDHANVMTLLKNRLGDVDGASSQAAGGSRMLMMQLSQVGQQAMATGNIAQALAIQLPDIGLAFGAVGAAAGLVAGIALPMAMAAFADTGQAAEAAAEAAQKSIGDMQAAVSAYTAATREAGQGAVELSAKYGLASAAAKEMLDALADVERVKAIGSVNDEVERLVGSLLEVQYFQAAGGLGEGQDFVLADTFRLAADEAHRLEVALVNLKFAKGLEDQARAAAEVKAALDAAYSSVDAMPPALASAYESIANIALAAGEVETNVRELPSALSAATNAASSLQGVVSSLSGTLSSAAANAWDLARGMWDAASAKAAAGTPQQQIDRANMVYGRVGSRSDPRAFSTPGAGEFVPLAGGRGGGKGGGGAGLAADLKSLQDELRSKEQIEIDSFTRRQETLRLALQQQLVTQQEYAVLMQAAQMKHAEAMSQIDVYRYGTGMDKAGQFFGDMEAAAQAGGGRMLAIAKSFGAAQALVAAYQAATMALATPGITPLGQLAAYAKILGAGLGAVSAIKGVTAGGGTSGGRGGGSVSTLGGGASVTAPQYSANVTLVGESFGGDRVAQVFRDLNEGLGRGFQINLSRA